MKTVLKNIKNSCVFNRTEEVIGSKIVWKKAFATPDIQ
jgi:hypothetical protein